MRNNLTNYRHITVWTDDQYPDFLFGVYSPRLEIDLDIARELIENRLEFCEGKEKYVLIDFTNVKSVTREAREYMNSTEGGLKGVLAGAFVSNNVVATLVVNLYLKMNNPIVPARFFTNREEALKWLVSVKNEQSVRS